MEILIAVVLGIWGFVINGTLEEIRDELEKIAEKK